MAKITGTPGPDTLFSLTGADSLYGYGDNDILVWDSGDGRDLFFGGDGDDQILTRNANFQGLQDDFDAGADSIEAIGFDSDGNNVANSGKAFTIEADNGSQVWDFSDAEFLNGKVTVSTGKSADTVTASDSSDATYKGGDGDDELNGGAAADVLKGQSGTDLLRGGGEDDLLYGGHDSDEVLGQAGDDKMIWSAGEGRDSFDGGGGDDQILSRAAKFEGLQNDFDAGAESVEMIGFDSDANNVANSGKAFTIEANNGSQVWDFSDAEFLNGKVTVSTGNNADTVTASDSSDATYKGGDGDDALNGGAAADVLIGQSGSDLLAGGDEDDLLYGGRDSDEVLGENGDDKMIWSAGDGRDSFDGGDGNDQILSRAAKFEGLQNDFDAGAESVEKIGFDSDGNNVANSGKAFTIEANNGSQVWDFSDAAFLNGKVTVSTGKSDDAVTASDSSSATYKGGDGDDDLQGGAAADVLKGQSGSDRIAGGDEDDLLYGGRDSDEVLGENGDDKMIWSAGDGRDSFDGGDGNDQILSRSTKFEGLQNDFDAGAESVEEIGFDSDANNVANSGKAFTIEANNGSQVWDFSDAAFLNGKVTVSTGKSDDTVTASDSSSATYKGGDGDDDLHGGAAADVLKGQSGTDLLAGGDEDDLLYGGRNSDVVLGEDGDDKMIWSAGDGRDSFDGGKGDDQILSRAAKFEGLQDDFNAGSEKIEAIGYDSDGNNVANSGKDLAIEANNGAQNWNFAKAEFLNKDVVVSTGKSDDQITASDKSEATYKGGDGDDEIVGGSRTDVIKGGTGSDLGVFFGADADQGDDYDGGAGNQDLLRLSLTPEQLSGGVVGTLVPFSNDLLTEIDAFRAHIATDSSVPFTFTEFGDPTKDDLTAVNWEDVEIGFQDGNSFASLEDCLAKGVDSVLIGNSGANDLVGDGANNLILGLGGSDTINGRTGEDCVFGGAGNDTIEVAGNQAEFDHIDGGAGNDLVLNVSNSHVTFDAFNTNGSIEELDANGKEVKGNGNANVFDFDGVKMTDVQSVRGQGGDDDITASNQTNDVTYMGEGGDDKLTGLTRVDVLLGGDGDDDIDGGKGADTLNGGTGSDKVSGGDGNDVIQVAGGLAEFDEMSGDGGNDLVVNISNSHITFDMFNADGSIEELDANGKEVKGNGGGNVFDFDGVEMTAVKSVRGLGGNDDITASNQTDGVTYEGGEGDDTLTGLTRVDVLFGGHDNDTIDGGKGADTLNGGTGIDTVSGGDGNDVIQVAGGLAEFDDMSGNGGNDLVVNVSNSHLTFDMFNTDGSIETLDANGKEVKGNGGDNVFDFDGVAMVGVASVRGLGGDDDITASNQTDGVTYEGGGGNDQLNGLTRADVLLGGEGDDDIEGGKGADTLNGGTGIDTVSGGDSNDVIQVAGGLAEFDDMSGGAGNDLVVNISNSHLTFDMFNTDGSIEELDANGKEVKGNGGANIFDFDDVSLVDVTSVRGLGGNDDITASNQTDGVVYEGGAGDDALTGLTRADVLLGGEGDDLIVGGRGNDTINGGTGNDDLTGGANNDTFVFDGALSGNEGTVQDFGVGDDLFKINVNGDGSNASFIGDAAFTGGDPEVRFQKIDGSSGELQVDSNGNGSANFTIGLNGVTASSQLSAGDFMFT